jgi:hypothetical protein
MLGFIINLLTLFSIYDKTGKNCAGNSSCELIGEQTATNIGMWITYVGMALLLLGSASLIVKALKTRKTP